MAVVLRQLVLLLLLQQLLLLLHRGTERCEVSSVELFRRRHVG